MEIKIKNSWSAVTPNEYGKIAEIKQEFEYGDISELDFNVELLSILSGETVDTLMSIPAIELPKLMQEARFIAKEPTGELKSKYIINGHTYNVVLAPEKLTTAQYIDLVDLPSKVKDVDIALRYAPIFIREGEKYDGAMLDEVAEDIRNHFNIADLCAVSLFFSTLFNALMNAILARMTKKLKRAIRKTKDKAKRAEMESLLTDLQRNGVGSRMFTT